VGAELHVLITAQAESTSHNLHEPLLAILVRDTGRDQLDVAEAARRRAVGAAGGNAAPERRADDRVVDGVGSRDRHTGEVLVDRAELEVPGERVDDEELDLRPGRPRRRDLARECFK
jgi:hypothetical protein